jgi:hypothetical protein
VPPGAGPVPGPSSSRRPSSAAARRCKPGPATRGPGRGRCGRTRAVRSENCANPERVVRSFGWVIGQPPSPSRCRPFRAAPSPRPGFLRPGSGSGPLHLNPVAGRTAIDDPGSGAGCPQPDVTAGAADDVADPGWGQSRAIASLFQAENGRCCRFGGYGKGVETSKMQLPSLFSVQSPCLPPAPRERGEDFTEHFFTIVTSKLHNEGVFYRRTDAPWGGSRGASI